MRSLPSLLSPILLVTVLLFSSCSTPKHYTLEEITSVENERWTRLVLNQDSFRVPSQLTSDQNPKFDRCQKLIRFEYPIETDGLRPGVPHTIENMNRYLREKLGNELIDNVRDPKTRFVVSLGPTSKLDGALADLENIKQIRDIENPFGAFNVLEITRKNGNRTFVLTNVNGQSRYIQVMSLLRLAGINSRRISLIGSHLSNKSVYLKTFKALGHQPDFVVFGFANTSLESLTTLLRPANAAEILEKNKIYANKKWQMPRHDRHELEHLGVQVLTLNSGKKIWLLDNEYGDRSIDLLLALQEHGYKKAIYLGTAGSINPNYKVGDIVTPKFLKTQNGTLRLDMLQSRLNKAGTLTDVNSPSLETKAWLQKQIEARVDFVEVELGKIASVISNGTTSHPENKFSAYLVISDLLNSPNPVDYTKWTDAHRLELKEKIRPILNDFINYETPEYERGIQYEIQNFITD